MADLYLDHDVSHRLASLLRAAGHDVVLARDLGMGDADDDEHLLLAARHSRVLITHNAKDYRLLHGAWKRWPQAWGVVPLPEHAGILILPHGTPEESSQRILALIEQQDVPLTNALHRWHPDHGWELLAVPS